MEGVIYIFEAAGANVCGGYSLVLCDSRNGKVHDKISYAGPMPKHPEDFGKLLTQGPKKDFITLKYYWGMNKKFDRDLETFPKSRRARIFKSFLNHYVAKIASIGGSLPHYDL